MIKNIIINKKYIFDIVIYIINDITNIGADGYSYIDFILNLYDTYNYVIKLHTKSMSYWTYLLNSIFMDLDELINIFEKNKDIGIIGHNRYLQPFYYGLSNDYKIKLNKILQKFNINEDINIDYLNILNNNFKIDFNYKKYYNYRPDIFNAKLNKNECYRHSIDHQNIELNHAIYDINSTSFIKFIAGTIYIVRGNILNNIKNKYSKELIYLKTMIEKIENIKYTSNFDKNGKLFRYANSLEYILQACIYSFNYKVYGYDCDTVLHNSLYIKNFYLNLDKTIINNNKPKILFISNELTNTGSPKILKNIIKECYKKYDIFLLSYYGGEDVNSFYEYIDKNKVFIIYEEKRELGFENFMNLIEISKKICDIIDPEIVYLNTLVSVFGIYGCYNKKRKLILHIHEAEDEIITLYNDNLIIGYDFLKYVNHVITVNNILNEIFEGITGSLFNYSIIYNDISVNINLNYSNNKIIKNNKILIGGIGSINRRKGFDIFIELAKKYDCFDFIWASNNNYDKILPNNMKIVNLKDDEIIFFYNNIDILLFTSRSESFSLSFWECLLCNKYVLVSNKTIPLDKTIFSNSNIELLDGYSSVKLFIPFLNKLKNNEINLKLLNNNLNTKYIKSICSNNIFKIIKIIDKHINLRNNIFLDINYPNEFELYKKLTIYDKFNQYNIQKDLLLNNFSDFNNSFLHYLNNGYYESRNIYKFPCLIKKRIIFILHELSHNGATKIGLDIANNLQLYYDIIVISWKNGNMINNYTFENKPIIIGQRLYEHNITKYLDRVEIAKNILKELNPSLVYINSSVSNDFYHASCNLNIPNIYHHHEGIMGYESELKGSQIPCEKFIKHYNIEKSLIYSASPLTTKCLSNIMGVKNINNIKEFQIINIFGIDNLKNNNINNIRFNNKKIIGMVGTTTFRKGYDIFLKLAKIFEEYTFCWVGCNIDEDIKIQDNMIFIKVTDNPYSYMNQFDYFLCTSREDIFGLVILESIYLIKPTILLKKSISSWKIFDSLGVICLDYDYSLDTFEKIIINLELYDFKININVKDIIREKYDISNIEFIINDINILIDGYINTNKISNNYFYCENYGYITYDFKKIEKIINKYHEIYVYDYNIYKKKYKDLELVLKTEEDYKNHWNSIGNYKRSMEINDWKLYIALNKNLLLEGIDCEEKLIEKNINYLDTIYLFDIDNYKLMNDDLKNINNNDLLNHFINNGCFEGRLCY